MNLGLISETTINANTGTSVYTNELSKNLTKYCWVSNIFDWPNNV